LVFGSPSYLGAQLCLTGGDSVMGISENAT